MYWVYYLVFCQNWDRNKPFTFLRRRQAIEDAEGQAKVVRDQGGTPTAEEVANARALPICDWLYSILSTLDTKASALMRLNGVLVAAMSFLFGNNDKSEVTWHWVSVFLAFSVATSTISIGCCLAVVSFDWNFYHFVKINDGPVNFKEELFHLQNVALFRQAMYRIAWTLSFLSIVGFFIYLFIRFYHMFSGH